MNNSLVLANLCHRKMRTALTAAGVALGITLMVLTAGLINGFVNSQGKRNSAVTAELMMRPANSKLGLGFEPTSTLSLPLALVEEIRTLEGIAEAIPVGQYLQDTDLIEGINYAAFTKVSDMRVVEGEPVERGNEIMIDRTVEKLRNLKVSDEMQVFGKPFRVVGIYEPESLGRFKIPLSTMQANLNRPFLCSMILIKVQDPNQQDRMAARLRARFPDYSFVLTKDLPALFARGTPALRVFKNVVVSLAVLISSLVMLLGMYTTIKERTKLIGILKSLGASKFWIVSEVEKEAMLISLLGIGVGFGLSFAGKVFIQKFTPLRIEFETVWYLYAFLCGTLSGILGSLYPALQAAHQDPVKALSYE
ncbi:MAG: ABC transporter permease [Acidobacteriota bacterium]